MKYDLSIKEDRYKAAAYFEKLMDKNSKIEIKKIYPKRTGDQNSYLHVLFSMYGLEFGYTIDEAKVVIKRDLGYIYEKNGVKFLEHTSEMSTLQLTDFIKKFRNLSSTQGLYLPEPHEVTYEMLNELEKHQIYLEGKFDY